MDFKKAALLPVTGLACFAGLAGITYPLQPSPAAAAAEEETPKEILAVQIRRQGFSCDKPQDAKRDTEDSKPDEAVWILHCEDAAYRIRLIPDMAADVERLD